MSTRKHDYREHEPTGERLGVSCPDCITQPAHSPLPWVYHSDIKAIHAQRGGCVTTISTLDATSNLKDANARFIVKAVNAHEELVSALREIGNLYHSKRTNVSAEDVVAEVGRIARAVLAKVDQ